VLFFLGFIVLLICLIVGVRYGGLGLAVVSGIGLLIFTFVFGYKPGNPPIDVMLTIMAVVTCAGFLQTSGGLNVMLKYAEKLLRKHPKYITILAPITTWGLTVLCGTGHVVYTMFPIIYDIAIKQNIRPERPMAVASVASQMGICASPASVAIVSTVAFMSVAGFHYGIVQILAVSIPATFCGVVCAALWSLRRGKDLDKDEDFQKIIKDPEQRAYIYGDTESLVNKALPRSYYRATFIFLIGILIIAFFGSFPDFVPHFSAGAGKPAQGLSMTVMIQMIMLGVAAVILLTGKVNVKDVANGSVFRAGMVALISVYGVAWMADTLFVNNMPFLKAVLGKTVIDYPWAYAIVLFLTSKLVNSQAAAIAIIMPIALSVGVNPILIIGFISASYGYFVLPTYPSDLACINFDRSGTTKIGKYVINHSFIIPGLIGISSGCVVGYFIAHAIL
jgi:anaerobic C4-dicarboxylate transporter DcuB